MKQASHLLPSSRTTPAGGSLVVTTRRLLKADVRAEISGNSRLPKGLTQLRLVSRRLTFPLRAEDKFHNIGLAGTERLTAIIRHGLALRG